MTATIDNVQRNYGFEQLEDYIGSYSEAKNKQKVKLEYYIPYLSNQTKPGNFSLSFVLHPYLRRMEDVPEPINSNIRIEKNEAAVWAVKRFSWNYNYKRGVQFLQELLSELKDNGLMAKESKLEELEIKVAHYSVQIMIPNLKRHEVWIKVQLPNQNRNSIE